MVGYASGGRASNAARVGHFSAGESSIEWTTTQARMQSRVVTWATEEGVRGAASPFMWRLAQAKARVG